MKDRLQQLLNDWEGIDMSAPPIQETYTRTATLVFSDREPTGTEVTFTAITGDDRIVILPSE